MLLALAARESLRNWGYAMSVVHEERAAHSAGPQSARYRTLLRRIMIRCPATRRAADTGFELLALPKVSAGGQMLWTASNAGKTMSGGSTMLSLTDVTCRCRRRA